MAEVWINEETLTAIGDAVRAKTGASGLLAPGDMITALDGVSGVYLFSKKETADGDVIGYAVADDLAKYPNGGEQNGYYWDCVGGVISFSMWDDYYETTTNYVADVGMTWLEWCHSKYNPNDEFSCFTATDYIDRSVDYELDGYTVTDNYSLFWDNTSYDNDNRPRGNDVIVPNNTYMLAMLNW